MNSQFDRTLVRSFLAALEPGSLLGAAGDCAMEVPVMSLLSKSELLAPDLYGLVADLAYFLKKNDWLLASAESCTGGLIAAAITELAGSSEWFERGFVSYSDAAKTELLGVDAALIERHGAVSEEVVRAMAQGALSQSHAQVALAVTGVAGPGGGSAAKPVGTVWFGWVTPAGVVSEMRRFDGDRRHVRQATVLHALERLLALVRPAAP